MGASEHKFAEAKIADAQMAATTTPSKAGLVHKSQTKQAAKQVATSTEPINLPTKSWRALLKEQPLSADAKPFTPTQQARIPKTSAVPATSLKAPVLSSEDDPEWMQYLSKKLNANIPVAPVAPPKPAQASPTSSFKGLAQRRHGAGRSGVENSEEPAPQGTPVVIQTGAYLKLLREGTAKNKKAPTVNPGRRPGNKDAQIAPSLIPFDASMNTASLVKSWSNMVDSKTPNVFELLIPTEEQPQQRSIQDDIAISKMLRDEDLSDPAYYSEAESSSVTRSSGSVHRLGRRPKMASISIRSYVMQDLSYHLDAAVGMMLLRLQRFTDQQRIIIANSENDKLAQLNQRRFVIGLKEVSRRTKQSKVACLIVAPDIEEDGNTGGLDDRMRELLATAYQNQTPVVFALSRARLGKALGKTLHISVLGILDAQGSQSLLKESVRLASECQQTWLARTGK